MIAIRISDQDKLIRNKNDGKNLTSSLFSLIVDYLLILKNKYVIISKKIWITITQRKIFL